MPSYILNIDTSRLMQLADGSDTNARTLVRELQGGSVCLNICILRAMELGRMPGDRRARMVSFLRDVQTVIGQPDEVLHSDELASACARATERVRRPPRPFARSTADWGLAFNALGGTAADLVALSESILEQDTALRSLLREHVFEALAHGRRAAVLSDRLVVVRAELEQHIAQFRLLNAGYADGLSAAQVIDRVDGIAGFPSYQVLAELLAARLVQRNPADRNDLVDEEIAKYHPYSAVSIFDRATTNRFWQATLPGRERVALDFKRAVEVLEAVRSGAQSPREFIL